jgi:Kelch motif/Galactose oxidase, central domain
MTIQKAKWCALLLILVAFGVTESGCGGGPGSPQSTASDPPPPTSSGSVSITPSADTLGPFSQRQFVAMTSVGGTVKWTIKEGPTGGTLNANGSYVAPGATGVFHIVASAAADSNRNAQATVKVVPSGFTFTGSAGHVSGSGILLASGEVLVVGPDDGSGVSAELFDPATGSFKPTQNGMVHPRNTPYAALLSDGRVLLAGGTDVNGFALTVAELFDPATESFTLTGDMLVARSGATVTPLQNGMILVAGGVDNSNTILSSAELYNPATGIFTAVGGMTTGRWAHTATLLRDGKVLLVGGRVNFTPNINSATAELFDPSTNRFTATGSMATGRNFHSATLLANGNVLVLGGNPSLFSTASGEVYDPNSGTFVGAGSLVTPREGHTATLLPNGKVLVAGGVDWISGPDSPEAKGLYSAELFDPVSGTSTFTGSLEAARTGHIATLLKNGRVLVTGCFNTAEVYK